MNKLLMVTMLFFSTLQAASIKMIYGSPIPYEASARFAFEDMPGNAHDWIGIYKEGDASTFGNLVKPPYYTDGAVSGEMEFGLLSVGNYEVRAFAANTWTPLATDKFVVVPNHDLTSISSVKDVYSTNEIVKVNYTTTTAGVGANWIAAFNRGASNTFANIVIYSYTPGGYTNSLNLGHLPAGNYDLRLFNRGEWTPLDTTTITVEGANLDTTIRLSNNATSINSDASLRVTVANMPGGNRDWVAVFPIDAPNTFANIVSYVFTRGVVNGEVNLGTIPVGNYELRAFAANSWRPLVTTRFSVIGDDITPTVNSKYPEYHAVVQDVVAVVDNMPNDDRAWVGIFPVGARNTFANIVVYNFTRGLESGEINLGGIPAGNYEMRIFNANSWVPRSTTTFRVIN